MGISAIVRTFKEILSDITAPPVAFNVPNSYGPSPSIVEAIINDPVAWESSLSQLILGEPAQEYMARRNKNPANYASKVVKGFCCDSFHLYPYNGLYGNHNGIQLLAAEAMMWDNAEALGAEIVVAMDYRIERQYNDHWGNFLRVSGTALIPKQSPQQ